MSDATVDNGHGERRRILACLAVACAVHGAILIALALGIGVGAGLAVPPPMTVELVSSAELGQDASGADGYAGAAGPGEGSADAASMPGRSTPAASEPAASSAVAAKPTASAPAASAPSRGQGGAADASSFVIPTPRAQPAETTPTAGGPAFRESGGKTGVLQGVPSVPSAVPAPVVPPVQQGKGAGTAASSGDGASSAQRSGIGVSVTGSAGSSSGKVDLGPLDNALAGTGGSAAGKGGGAGSSAGAAAAGTGSGAAGSGGSGGGSASGGSGGGSASGGSGGQSYSVLWGTADSGKGRTLVFKIDPVPPRSVSAQGLRLSVTVKFTLLDDGVIGGVKLERSSGSGEVDSAVLDAIRRWRFTSAKGAAPAEGIISYVIQPR